MTHSPPSADDGYRPGLAGVVAARTAVSRVDGAAGRLWFRGRPIQVVADQARSGFADAAAIVLNRPIGDLGAARSIAFERQQRVAALGLPADPMGAVRALVAGAPEPTDPTGLLAEVAIAVGLVAAVQSDRAPVPPDPDAEHAADTGRMAIGRVLDPAEASALAVYLCTVMDHGLNASTFTARVVASTRASDVDAVTAAIGALAGPLHGGAPGPVLDMLDAIGSEDAERWIRAELDAGRRIMGMGHRVYRVRDPRAAVLEGAVRDLAPSARLTLARHVESRAEAVLAERYPDRSLRANVEFYTAVLLEAIGLPRPLFTPMFAAGRVVGWLAHIAEERAVGRIIRPVAAYVGPTCT
jgi:citrate synthase